MLTFAWSNGKQNTFTLMKKTILGIILALMAFTAKAQHTPHAIGAHFGGSTIDVEYQYHFSKKNFLDVTAGIFDLGNGLALQGIYNWNIWRSHGWTPKFADWKFWGGFGGGLGFYDHDEYSGMFLGPAGTLGFGFTLKVCPLTVGIDYRPMIAIQLGEDSGINDRGFRNLGLTVTYRF